MDDAQDELVNKPNESQVLICTEVLSNTKDPRYDEVSTCESELMDVQQRMKNNKEVETNVFINKDSHHHHHTYYSLNTPAAKDILKTMIEKCKLEAALDSLACPISKIEDRVSYYTGFTKQQIASLVSEKPKVSRLDLSSRITILETLKLMHALNKELTLENLLNEILRAKEIKALDNTIVTKEELLQELEVFRFQILDSVNYGTTIIEEPETRFERFNFLNKLKRYRCSNSHWKQIVYIDERLINDTQTFPKPWMINGVMSGTLEHPTFLHALSKNGYINGILSNERSENVFLKWVKDILVDHLTVPSVIILDNNPIYGKKQTKMSKFDSKCSMLKWLTNHNIPCNNKMSRPELYELFKNNYIEDGNLKIDQIFRSQGHEVLHLPHNFYDLSMTTLLWNDLAKYKIDISKPNVIIQNQIVKLLTIMEPTVYVEYSRKIEKIENEIFNIDMTIEKLTDKYEFKI